MALESATYLNQLVATNPSSTDSVSQSDDHLRLIKLALKNTFPNLDSPVTATPAQLNFPVPQGFIGFWSGAIAGIPAGWALCDGTQGTPDLRSKFVVGAGSDYAVNDTGGSASTGMAGSHTHTLNNTTANPTVTTGPVQAGTGATVVTGVTAVAHTHTANLIGDHQHSSLPPYLALAYIMKL
jgi:microcystin-dependent protein